MNLNQLVCFKSSINFQTGILNTSSRLIFLPTWFAAFIDP